MNSPLSKPEEFQKHVVPLIPSESLDCVFACLHAAFEPVNRYMKQGIHLDFELIATVNYADVVQQGKLKNVISFLSDNGNRYSDKELLFLFLRSMISVVWKLDVLLLTHLTQCATANLKWNNTLIHLSQDELQEYYFRLNQLPYWLRNTSINFYSALPTELKSKYANTEFVMIKANDIHACCKLIGQTHIIALDSGIYTYLQEWCKMLVHGYRVKEYCNKNNWAITDPVKTGARFFVAIADIMNNVGSVYQMPPSSMIFCENDNLIIRDIVENQICFIIGHEFGHIVLHSSYDNLSDKSIEFEADDFSAALLKNFNGTAGILNKADRSVNLPIEENDIQSRSPYERRIESAELLFFFFDAYHYACRKRGYAQNTDNFHPDSSERKKNLCKQYPAKSNTPLADYAENLICRIKSQIDIITHENNTGGPNI